MTVVLREDPLNLDALRARARSLLEQDSWSSERLLAKRRARLRSLLRHAIASSSYYRETFGPDAEDAELTELPPLSKPVLMEQFDRIVTDPRVCRADVEAFLSEADAGKPYLGTYHVFATSGTTGVPGIFLYSHEEFAEWVAGGLSRFLRLGVKTETRLVAIGAPSSLHITRRLFAGFEAGREDVPRLSVVTPIADSVASLNAYQPEAIVAYASVAGELADEQLRGVLSINPRLIVVGSEVLTDETAQRIESAWGISPVNVYASTEAPLMAVSSPDRCAMQVWHGVILEVVDDDGHPVPAGASGSKVLLTNLVNRAQPLIRYELSDSAVLATDGAFPEELARVDGRSDDILTLPARAGGNVRVHPYWLRAPFTSLPEVRQYQIVRARDGLLVRIVPARSAPRDLSARVRACVVGQLEAAGGLPPPVTVEPVSAIGREPGHAAKIKLVTSAS